jgi:prepilin signal peptidase PulO-like enzyme (type II secretory pathway)
MLALFSSILTSLIAAGVFAGASYLGIELSKIVGKHTVRSGEAASAPDGIRDASHPLSLIGGGALFGAVIAWRGMDWQTMALAASVCISLAACWHSALAHGTISDYFTLVPLGAIGLSSLVQQNWPLLLSVIAAFVPFAAMAYITKEKGMGWDDAKLAAFGGAILGMQLSLLAYAVACVVAVIVAWACKRTAERILFAPYMISAIAICLAWSYSPY